MDVVRNIMIPEFYKRPHTFKTSIHRAIIITCISGILFSVFTSNYDYTVLILIFYLVIDFILNPNTVSITKSELIVSKLYLAGLIKRNYTISLDKILNITSISRATLNDSTVATGSIIPWIGRGETYFSLFQLDYFDNNFKRNTLNVNLHIDEYKMLQEILRTTSASGNWGLTE